MCGVLKLVNNHLAEDKKRPGAAQRSLYYLVNGNPNKTSQTGG